MIEHHLQQLWQNKRLPFHLFCLTSGSPITIIQTGIWNIAGSGPDFQLAEIYFDGLKWFGSIEFHLKSSDWYKHRHHQDQSYENVILHVVHEHDQEVFVRGSVLPTLELKPYLQGEFSFPKYYDWNKASKISCGKRLSEFLPSYREMQHLAIQLRLNRKFQEAFGTGLTKESVYRLLSMAFGTKTNALSFEILSQQVPLDWHVNKSERELIEIIHSNQQGWKSKNFLLQSKIRKRVLSWLRLIRWYFFENDHSKIQSEVNWSVGFETAGIENSLLQNNIRINAIAYIEIFKKQVEKERSSGILKGMKYLQQISPEKNRNTRHWKHIGIHAKNAFETQANLEIYQQFCTQNKCLQCCVGQKLLKS